MIEIRPDTPAGELVGGRPDEIDRTAARLSRFATDAAGAAARLDGLDSAHWSGTAADLFRAAMGPMPGQLRQASEAFGLAGRALSGYAQAIRDGQAVAARAVRMVAGSTPDSAAADQAEASRLVERARAEVEHAARAATARLRQLATDVPPSAAGAAAGAVRSGGVVIQAAVEHELSDPEGFVASPDVGDSVRFGSDHTVAFSGSEGGDWSDWAAGGEGRTLGAVGVAVLAGLGIGAVGLIGRRRRERTALATAGIDEADLRRRRERAGGARPPDGPAARGRSAGSRGLDTWRTRLASSPRPGATVHVWAGSEANPLTHARRAESVPTAAPGAADTGAVRRIGPPPGQGRADPGARR
jgi:hypothetical protein